MKRVGLNYSLWSFLFGIILSNFLPAFTSKLAPMYKQAEFFIKCGVVLLACPLEDVAQAGLTGLTVAWGETTVTWHLILALGVFAFKLDPTVAVTFTTGITVCGASAATAAGATMGCPGEVLCLCIAFISLVSAFLMVVLPYFAVHVLGLSAIQSGAAMAGSLDGTGNVVAAAALLDDVAAAKVAVLVKMSQNLYLPLIIVLISGYKDRLLEHWQQGCPMEEGAQVPCDNVAETRTPFLVKMWDGLPKFIVGYVLLGAGFSIFRSLMPDPAFVRMQEMTRGTSEWWFCIGFVSVGLSTNINALRKRMSLGKVLAFAVLAEIIDFAMTFAVAVPLFRGQ